MYYASTNDLPRTLQETLPAEAQAIYLQTYNRVWDEQTELGDNAPKRSRVAHQMAWDAINEQFTLVRQDEGSQWRRKGEEAVQVRQPAHDQKRGFWARLGFG